MNNRIIPASKLNNENAGQYAKILQDRITQAIKNSGNNLTDEAVIKAATEYNDFISRYID